MKYRNPRGKRLNKHGINRRGKAQVRRRTKRKSTSSFRQYRKTRMA